MQFIHPRPQAQARAGNSFCPFSHPRSQGLTADTALPPAVRPWDRGCPTVGCSISYLFSSKCARHEIFVPNVCASLESTLKMMKNALNNLFTDDRSSTGGKMV